MIVFKFGGGCIKDASAIERLKGILETYRTELVVVVSAMGKTTNALEEVVGAYYAGKPEAREWADKIFKQHYAVCKELFQDKNETEVFHKIGLLFDGLMHKLNQKPSADYNFEYDQIIAYGELLSSTIIAGYLRKSNLKVRWWDIRENLKTDENYREASVNWELSVKLIRSSIKFETGVSVFITQGFIGSNEQGFTTTLGREGSDYSAAILANILDAEKIMIWKDVHGVYNADPKFYNNVIKLDRLSYLDAIELAYYGTSIIHPRTIQPLQQKNIELNIKAFYHPEEPGTIIGFEHSPVSVPSYIFMKNQILLHIQPSDLSFVTEAHLHEIFKHFARHRVRINLMQHSAVSFKICVTNDQSRVPNLLKSLGEDYLLSFVANLELITIRNYDEPTKEKILNGRKPILEQRQDKIIQFLIRDEVESSD